uniref:Uncharacterized protein n=1 Tax=Rhizophora mucronata TaxID=61149 RepID=A0A2P2P4I1_RHIMU
MLIKSPCMPISSDSPTLHHPWQTKIRL